jgi:hypothetical protein
MRKESATASKGGAVREHLLRDIGEGAAGFGIIGGLVGAGMGAIYGTVRKKKENQSRLNSILKGILYGTASGVGIGAVAGGIIRGVDSKVSSPDEYSRKFSGYTPTTGTVINPSTGQATTISNLPNGAYVTRRSALTAALGSAEVADKVIAESMKHRQEGGGTFDKLFRDRFVETSPDTPIPVKNKFLARYMLGPASYVVPEGKLGELLVGKGINLDTTDPFAIRADTVLHEVMHATNPKNPPPSSYTELDNSFRNFYGATDHPKALELQSENPDVYKKNLAAVWTRNSVKEYVPMLTELRVALHNMYTGDLYTRSQFGELLTDKNIETMLQARMPGRVRTMLESMLKDYNLRDIIINLLPAIGKIERTKRTKGIA